MSIRTGYQERNKVTSKPPKLTADQKAELRALEPALRLAVQRGNYSKAKQLTAQIQRVLRPTGHETRLMQAKNWLFEAAMEAGELQIAKSGFIGIRKKTSPRTRVYLEATALLAICYLREKNLNKAEPLIAEVLQNDTNIRSEKKRRQFRQHVIERFEEEILFAALQGHGGEILDPDEVQAAAGHLVQTKTEDQLLILIGQSLPQETVDFLFKVDEFSKRQLPAWEVKYLPPPERLAQKRELGKTFVSAAQRVLWRSLCDPESEIYKAWFHQGVMIVLDKKYIAVAVTAALSGLNVGIKALAVSATALIIKVGIEIFCETFKPRSVMIGPNEK